jgi:hypothetical protein
MTGTVIVTGALIAYSIFVFAEQRQSVLTKFVLTALSLGILLDITATSLMIIGSRNSAITFHGMLGYSALTGMLVNLFLRTSIWQEMRGSRS